jgi:hypothetical protein
MYGAESTFTTKTPWRRDAGCNHGGAEGTTKRRRGRRTPKVEDQPKPYWTGSISVIRRNGANPLAKVD